MDSALGKNHNVSTERHVDSAITLSSIFLQWNSVKYPVLIACSMHVWLNLLPVAINDIDCALSRGAI